MYAAASGLVIMMKRSPFETLRMFHFLDAIEFSEEDVGQGSLKAEPTMEYDVSWYITWMTIIILVLVSVFMYYAGKHYDEMKKMELWLAVRQAGDPDGPNAVQQNPIHSGTQAAVPRSPSSSKQEGSPRKEKKSTDESRQKGAVAENDNKQAEEGQNAA